MPLNLLLMKLKLLLMPPNEPMKKMEVKKSQVVVV
jgi:hypothetical protein